MKDRRKFIRFPVKLDCRYCKENQEELYQCSVINISKEGMGIVVYLKRRTPLGSNIKLEIHVPEKETPVCAKGTVTWIKKLKKDPDFDYKAGVRLVEIDSGDKWILLDYAYETWREKKKTG